MKKLFLSDVDGTLLKTGRDPHPAVVEGVRRFVRAGGRFALSTGRSVSAVERLVRQLPVNSPCVLCSGALLYDFARDRALSVKGLDGAVRGLLGRVLEEYPGVSVTVYTAGGLWNLRRNELLCTRGVYEDRTAPLVGLEEIRDPVKVLFSCEEVPVLEEIGEKWARPGPFDYHAASTHFYELTPRGVCKGTAALELRAAVGGAEGCRLFAAGDAPSDLTMRPAAEKFFAPVTAPEPVRAQADFLFPPPGEGGLALALDRVMAEEESRADS